MQFRLFLMAPATRLKRKRKHNTRQIINIILWLLQTGCQWRNLPEEWPHWQAVYYYFDQWKQDGTFERINLALNQLDRERVEKQAYPSVLYIDSQSRSTGAVKLNPMIYEYRVQMSINGSMAANDNLLSIPKADSGWRLFMLPIKRMVPLLFR